LILVNPLDGGTSASLKYRRDNGAKTTFMNASGQRFEDILAHFTAGRPRADRRKSKVKDNRHLVSNHSYLLKLKISPRNFYRLTLRISITSKRKRNTLSNIDACLLSSIF
jgi:hypothetical protein